VNRWHVQGCEAVTGDGIYDGMGWLSKHIITPPKLSPSGVPLQTPSQQTAELVAAASAPTHTVR
jgi:hypothetical protein